MELGASENQFRFHVWLKQAQHDIEAARKSVEIEYFEWACFQAEQAAEKALKAVLVYYGRSAPKLHKLGVLIGLVKNVETRFRGIHIDIAELQSYTFNARYPFLIPGNYETPHDYITKEEAEVCIKQAEIILNLIKEFLKD